MLQKIGKVYCISDFMVPLGIVIKTTVMVQILLYQYDHSCEAESSTAYFDIKVYSLCQKSTFLQIATKKFLTTSNFKTFLSELKQKSTCLKVHSVAKVYAVLPFYDVKCLCSGGQE